jgi:stage V sporulation protein AF
MQADLTKKCEFLTELLSVDNCFDMIARELIIGGRSAIIYTINGFTDAGVMQRVVQYLIALKEDEIPNDMNELGKKCIPYGDVTILKTYEQTKLLVFSGLTAILIDGFAEGIAIDCREFPCRGVSEPDKDKVMRGSRDGFVETLVFNIALIRRRIRSSEFCAELLQIGTSSMTDVSLCYMKGRADEKFVQNVKDRLEHVRLDSLCMSCESLAEAIYKGRWINPFPKFKYSERPDTTAASLLEGCVAVMVDNSPAAMIIPTTLFDIIEDADDYYFSPVTGTYLRLSRFIITLATLFITPLYLLICKFPAFVPEWLIFTLPAEPVNIPIVLQFIILEFAIDGLKLASLNTPDTLSMPLSVTAGIVVGEFAISSGWFNQEIMLYMAFVTIANYSQSSFELGYALKFMRIILLTSTALFGIWGFFGGIAFVLICIISNETVAGTPYLYPYIPLNFKEICKQFLRVDIKQKK